ncbi:MAG: FtsQ-type POTRA domain-containing protein [Candidatus Staskawiczbacteria bacterium]|nr:FtsQ-type POTRA domain-containing protein [Candidatus Staskawiczbacteria bacterium]
MTSYRKKHIKGKIHNIKPRKSIFKRPWFWIVFLCLAIVLSALYFFLFYDGVQVKNVIIYGNRQVPSRNIETLVYNLANNKILKIGSLEVSTRSIFLVNSEKINKEILKDFIIIEKAEVSKIFSQTLEVSISERTLVGIFCGADTQCYLIDGNGIAFGQIKPEQLNSSYLIVRQVADNGQIYIGEKIVEKNVMGAILKVQKNLKDNFQISLTEALIASSSRLSVSTEEGWKVYFDLSADSDINSQLTKLNLLLSNEISVANRKNLRYIDLRPKDRAIICDNKTCGG